MTSPRYGFDQGPMLGPFEHGGIITDDGTEWAIIGRLKRNNFPIESKPTSTQARVAQAKHLRGFMCKFPALRRSFDDAQTHATQTDPAIQPDELEVYRIPNDYLVVSTMTPKLLESKVSMQELQ
ncbi:hypothetical protein F1880_001757 [Penicillium rolfsii]|nr:hypothetical protein F1880_001757 [Penicillium rolfsii]